MIFYLETLGCKLNQAESEQLAAGFLRRGWRWFRGDEEEPKVVVVNTCAVTLKAERESRQRVAHLKRRWPASKLIVTGCFRQTDWPGVDEWLPNQQKDKIMENLEEMEKIESMDNFQKAQEKVRAFIKIQTGCNNFCSFCIVPFLRGRPQSVSAKEVVQQIRDRVQQGFREVVLTGVNIGLYGLENKDTFNFKLVDLLRKILSETRIERVRLSSLWPTDISDELIKLMAVEPRLCPHLHLSIQSGSDKVLKFMRRGYPVDKIMEQVKKAKNKIKNVNFTADIIVGFPGETRDDFQASCELVKKAGFGKTHIFRFSSRPGTKIEGMEELARVDEAEIRRRSKYLEEIAKQTSRTVKNRFIGRQFRVLWEGKRNGWWQGYTENYFLVKSRRGVRNVIQGVKVKKIDGQNFLT